MKSSSILVVFDDLTEFYAIKEDVNRLQKNNPVDIVVVRNYSETMYTTTIDVMSGMGYNVKTQEEIKKNKYKVVLEPYPILPDINSEFYIRYQYGVAPASVKPNPVYTPEWSILFDVEICYSQIAKDILSVYSKPFIVKPLQFGNFKLHKKGKKTNLLILMTWGDVRATQKLAKIKEQLGEKYNVIIKAHHAVQYRPDHEGIAEELKNIADEYYDSTTDVNRLFERADIVLTDNSSSVFEAIYLGIPAAIFSEATSDYYSLNGIKAAHFSLLIEPKRIPYTNKVEEVKKIIEQAPKNIDRQNQLKDELYPSNIQETLVDVVERYLQINRKNEPYYIVRDLLLNKKRVTESTLLAQTKEIDNLRSENNILKDQLQSFLGVKRSATLLSGNIKRKIKKSIDIRK